MNSITGQLKQAQMQHQHSIPGWEIFLQRACQSKYTFILAGKTHLLRQALCQAHGCAHAHLLRHGSSHVVRGLHAGPQPAAQGIGLDPAQAPGAPPIHCNAHLVQGWRQGSGAGLVQRAVEHAAHHGSVGPCLTRQARVALGGCKAVRVSSEHKSSGGWTPDRSRAGEPQPDSVLWHDLRQKPATNWQACSVQKNKAHSCCLGAQNAANTAALMADPTLWLLRSKAPHGQHARLLQARHELLVARQPHSCPGRQPHAQQRVSCRPKGCRVRQATCREHSHF